MGNLWFPVYVPLSKSIDLWLAGFTIIYQLPGCKNTRDFSCISDMMNEMFHDFLRFHCKMWSISITQTGMSDTSPFYSRNATWQSLDHWISVKQLVHPMVHIGPMVPCSDRLEIQHEGVKAHIIHSGRQIFLGEKSLLQHLFQSSLDARMNKWVKWISDTQS